MPAHSPQIVSDTTLTDIYAFVHQREAGRAPAAQAAAPAGRVEHDAVTGLQRRSGERWLGCNYHAIGEHAQHCAGQHTAMAW